MTPEAAQPGQPSKLRTGAPASGTTRDLQNSRYLFAWPDNANLLPAVPVKLLDSAQQALDGNGRGARQFIARAADLLNALRAASFHSSAGFLICWGPERKSNVDIVPMNEMFR